MSKKIYVLDTNVLLSDFNALYAFKNNDVVIPLKVLEEIDKHKKRQDGVGANARQVIRELDKLREKGSLIDGAKLGGRKGTLFVKGYENAELPADMSMEDPDNQILATVKNCLSVSTIPVVLVSQDINVRVKADALGFLAEDYTTNQIVEKAEEVYTGFTQHLVDDAMIDRFDSGEKMSLEEKDIKLFPNQTENLKQVFFKKPLEYVVNDILLDESQVKEQIVDENLETADIYLNLLVDEEIDLQRISNEVGKILIPKIPKPPFGEIC